jgi:hypothetical protein
MIYPFQYCNFCIKNTWPLLAYLCRSDSILILSISIFKLLFYLIIALSPKLRPSESNILRSSIVPEYEYECCLIISCCCVSFADLWNTLVMKRPNLRLSISSFRFKHYQRWSWICEIVDVHFLVQFLHWVWMICFARNIGIA